MIIENGTGNGGYKAKVNKYSQLSVISEEVPSEGAQSTLGNAFIVHAECHTAAASSGGFLYIKNNEPNVFVEITRIYIDPHTITPTNLIITQWFDPTPVGGTDLSSTAVIQKNRGSGATLNLNILASTASGDLTLTGGTRYHSFSARSMISTERNMNFTNQLVVNKSIAWGWKTVSGANAVDGEVISFSINMIKRSIES